MQLVLLVRTKALEELDGIDAFGSVIGHLLAVVVAICCERFTFWHSTKTMADVRDTLEERRATAEEARQRRIAERQDPP